MHSLFIIPKASAGWFNQQAEALGNDGPAYVPSLSRDGKPPATHGWCAVTLSAEQEAAVLKLLEDNLDRCIDWSTYDLATEPDWPQHRAAALNLEPVRGAFP